MISTAHRFIFLHAPKTGGNSIQSVLLPFSDDRKVLNAHQDGKDRFSLRGRITQTKHMDLQGYADVLGDRLSDFRVILTVRDPVERCLSAYFSPIRLIALTGSSEGSVFSHSEFAQMAADMKSLVSFLTVGSAIRKPDYLLRFDDLRRDFGLLLEHIGLPALELPTLNVSGDKLGLRDRLRLDDQVREIVYSKFSDDYEYFGEALR